MFTAISLLLVEGNKKQGIVCLITGDRKMMYLFLGVFDFSRVVEKPVIYGHWDGELKCLHNSCVGKWSEGGVGCSCSVAQWLLLFLPIVLYAHADSKMRTFQANRPSGSQPIP